MHITTEEHPFVNCEIQADENHSHFIGTLSYRGFENEKLRGDSIEAVCLQFQTICDLLDSDGAMLRLGTIMLGYRNDVLRGDVLLPDGEIIGYWEMEDDDDTSHFTPDGASKPELSAPSAWMLQDAIARWLAER